MKKMLIMILAFTLLLSMAGCGSKDAAGNTETPGSESTSSILNNEITTPTEISGNSGNALFISSESDGCFVKPLSNIELWASATDIVIATYTGALKTQGTNYDLIFSPVRQLKGSEITGDFHLRISGQYTSVSSKPYIQNMERVNEYMKGMNYVLILKKHVSVYEPYDVYSSMIHNYIREDNIDHFNQQIELIETFLEKGIDRSRAIGYDYLKTDDLSEVVAQTPIIVEVIPVKFDEHIDRNNTDVYLCEVKNVLKGSILKETMISDTTVKIQFMAGTVEIGSKYIVMLADTYSYIRSLSSKISVHRSDSATGEQIKTMINNASAAQ